ncbi:MAG: hypothetical protein AB4290_13195 [Spirulina sp.]
MTKEEQSALVQEAQESLQQIQSLANHISKNSNVDLLWGELIVSQQILEDQLYSDEYNLIDLKKAIAKVNANVNRINSIVSIQEELEEKEKDVLELIKTLSNRIAKEIIEDTEKRERLFERLQKAERFILENKNLEDQKEIIIQQAEFEAKSVNAIILRELQVRNEEKALRYLVPILILVYISLIISTIIVGNFIIWDYTTTIPILGIPISVILWAALGSLAAVLYRFYTQQFGKITEEIRWLIARPIIGIIMGCLSYLAIISGLIIFGNTSPSLETTENSRLYVFWIIAFLGGFSDRFFESIIDVLAGKIAPKNDGKTKK